MSGAISSVPGSAPRRSSASSWQAHWSRPQLSAALVVEAAPERLELKQELFARLSRAAPDAILASNTSVMSIGDIARDTERPERVVGTHFWNPPHLVPLVEVTQAERTDAATVERDYGHSRGGGEEASAREA